MQASESSERGSSQPPSPAGGSGAAPGTGGVARVLLSGDTASGPDDVTRVASSGGGGFSGVVEPPAIEGYALLRELHRGGQGVVYHARQLGTKREVALKVLLEGPFASEESRRRFEREVELAASLRHPHIVTILDSGISHGRYYFAMEYIDGQRLDVYLREAAPPLDRVLALLETIGSAVNFAHQRGVIHRDLKPSNILVDGEGAPHVLDFGLAKQAPRGDHRHSTVHVVSTPGQILGTVAYMSPEQVAAPHEVDVRTDVYALGVIAYEALLGRPPYPVTGQLAEVLRHITHTEPANPRAVRSQSRFGKSIDDELATILLKALEKDVERRYQSAGDLAADVRRYRSGEPIEAKRASGFYVLRKTLRRYRVQATVAGAILGMILVFMVIFAVLYARESLARADAERNRILAVAKELAASRAADRERDARRDAEQAAARLSRALVWQRIDQGDSARERGDLGLARDAYWEAWRRDAILPARWSLRQYYFTSLELDARQLYPAALSVASMSPDAGSIVLSAPRGLLLRSAASGAALGWFATPSAATAVSVDGTGLAAGAGPGWVRVWRVGQFQPVLAIDVPSASAPAAVFIVGDAEAVLWVDERTVLIAGADGAVRELALPGRLTGRPGFDGASARLAAPTDVGVVLVERGAGGDWHDALVWRTETSAPRAVHFGPRDGLAVLSEFVDVVSLSGAAERRARRLFAPAGQWDLLDVRSDAALVALARRDGAVALYRGGRVRREWRVSHAGLIDARLSPDGESVLTLDGRGSLTRWSCDPPPQERLAVSDRPVSDWCVSDDCSTAVLVESGERISVYTPATDLRPRTLPGSRLMLRMPGLREPDLGLSLAADGSRLLIRNGANLTLFDLRQRRVEWTVIWRDPRWPTLLDAQLSPDGRTIARRVGTLDGADQRLVFSSADARAVRLGAEGSAVSVAGAGIRGMRFAPHSTTLLLARADGAMLLAAPDTPALGEWTQLDSPATRVAFDQGGTRVAVVTEDRLLRLLSWPAGEALWRVVLPDPVSSVSFNPDGGLLLIRATDGTLQVLDPDSREQLVRARLPGGGPSPLGAWIGGADGMLLGMDERVVHWRSDVIDVLAQRNADFAAQREAARRLADGEWDAAWEACDDVPTREDLLESILSRPGARAAWADRVQTLEPTPALYLRLAHAAFEGRRYHEAREWFADAAHFSALDAESLRRLAESEYLLDNFGRAADLLSEALGRADLGAGSMARVQVERAAALRLAGRLDEARAAAAEIGAHPRVSGRLDRVAMSTWRSVGALLAGDGNENVVTAAIGGLLANMSDEALPVRDDPHFFMGELARARGRRDDAFRHYQRCIELSRDDWPAAWAKWRIRQLTGRGSDDGAGPVGENP